MQSFNILASLCGLAERFESYLVCNPEDRFSHGKTQGKSLIQIWILSNEYFAAHGF